MPCFPLPKACLQHPTRSCLSTVTVMKSMTGEKTRRMQRMGIYFATKISSRLGFTCHISDQWLHTRKNVLIPGQETNIGQLHILAIARIQLRKRRLLECYPRRLLSKESTWAWHINKDMRSLYQTALSPSRASMQPAVLSPTYQLAWDTTPPILDHTIFKRERPHCTFL